jgi:hypothetical protein
MDEIRERLARRDEVMSGKKDRYARSTTPPYAIDESEKDATAA